MKTYLGLDPSSKCGVAIWSEGQAAPLLDKKTISNWSACDGKMLMNVRAIFWPLIRDLEPDEVFIEDLILAKHQNVAVYRKQAMALGLLQWICAELSIPCTLIAISTWRSDNYGYSRRPKGYPWKAKALEFTSAMGWDHQKDDNAAEAGLILRSGLIQKGQPDPFFQAAAQASLTASHR